MAERNTTSRLAKRLWERRHPEWADGHPGRIDPHFHFTPRGVPRYAVDQLSIRTRETVRGRQPWITRHALRLLDQMLRPIDRGLEFGAGGTTPWFAERVAFLDSVEGVPRWHAPLQRDLGRRGITNVDLHLVSADELGYETDEHREAYVGVRPDLTDESLDFAFVDGEYRDECAMRSIDLVAPGGLLILDNADLYLPSRTRSPCHLDRPSTPLWETFLDVTATWRRIWTTNGVWDTVLWFKP